MRKKLKALDRRIDFILKRDKPWHQYRDEEVEIYKGYKSTVRRYLCPVCGEVMECSTDYMEHIMLEEHERCPNRCYSYSFVTGATETCIGSVVVHGYYTDDKEEREHQSRVLNMALIHERGRHRARQKNDQKAVPESP